MKFFLVSMVCLIGAVLAQPGHTKQKRDVLPGDPRYDGFHVERPTNHLHVLYGPPHVGSPTGPSNTYIVPQAPPQKPPSSYYVPAPGPRPIPVPAPTPLYIPQDPEIDIRLGRPGFVHGGSTGGSYGGGHRGYVY